MPIDIGSSNFGSPNLIGPMMGSQPMPVTPPITLKRHQEITSLAYSVKGIMDQRGLTQQEAVTMVNFLQTIINLK